MKLYDCKVRLAGSVQNEVRKSGVSKGEMTLFRALHGSDAVIDVVENGSVKRSEEQERERLYGIYGSGGNLETRARVEQILGPRPMSLTGDDEPEEDEEDDEGGAPPAAPPPAAPEKRQTLSLKKPAE